MLLWGLFSFVSFRSAPLPSCSGSCLRKMADDVPNRGPELMGVNIAFLVAALVSILLRCYVRAFMVKAFGVDDWLMVVASVRFSRSGGFCPPSLLCILTYYGNTDPVS